MKTGDELDEIVRRGLARMVVAARCVCVNDTERLLAHLQAQILHINAGIEVLERARAGLRGQYPKIDD